MLGGGGGGGGDGLEKPSVFAMISVHGNNKYSSNPPPSSSSRPMSTQPLQPLANINPDSIFARRVQASNTGSGGGASKSHSILMNAGSSAIGGGGNSVRFAPSLAPLSDTGGSVAGKFSSYDEEPSSPTTTTQSPPSHHPIRSSKPHTSTSSTHSSSHGKFMYKLVAKCGPNYFSIYDGVTPYKIGEVLRQPARPNKAGGYFVYATPEEAMNTRIPDEAALYVAPRALLKCLCWGDCITYGKSLCFSSLRPVQIFPLHFGTLNTHFSDRVLTTVSLEQTRARLPPFHGPLSTTANSMVGSFRPRAHLKELYGALQAQERVIQEIARKQLERLKQRHANAPSH